MDNKKIRIMNRKLKPLPFRDITFAMYNVGMKNVRKFRFRGKQKNKIRVIAKINGAYPNILSACLSRPCPVGKEIEGKLLTGLWFQFPSLVFFVRS